MEYVVIEVSDKQAMEIFSRTTYCQELRILIVYWDRTTMSELVGMCVNNSTWCLLGKREVRG